MFRESDGVPVAGGYPWKLASFLVPGKPWTRLESYTFSRLSINDALQLTPFSRVLKNFLQVVRKSTLERVPSTSWQMTSRKARQPCGKDGKEPSQWRTLLILLDGGPNIHCLG